jgi:hypothetical protein
MEWGDIHPLGFHNLDETTVITYPFNLRKRVISLHDEIKQKILLKK